MTPPVGSKPPQDFRAYLEEIFSPEGKKNTAGSPSPKTGDPESPRYRTQGWGIEKLLGDFTSGRFPTSALTPASPLSLPTKPAPAQVTWWDFLAQLADAVETMNLDMYNVPANGGQKLCRFSEYTPRNERPKVCKVSFEENTTARIYGEVRPVEGQKDSLMSRFVIDYQPDVTYLFNNPEKPLDAILPDLKIDGFEAIVSPHIEYKKPIQGHDAVQDVTEVDYKYEAPLGKGVPFHTPLDSVRPPLPGGHRDWMIRFQPVRDSLMAEIEELGANPQGKLLLWPFLHQQGYYEDRHYKQFGIRPNTFPRRPGDLIRFFTKESKKNREEQKQNARYINPNSEYITDQGRRQDIPEDLREVQQINRERSKLGRPELNRKRKRVLDWDFGELAKDSERLAKMKPEDLPRAIAEGRWKEVVLQSPLGEIALDAGTEIHAHLYLNKVRNPHTKKFEGQRGVRVRIRNLGFKNIDLSQFGFQIKADSLRAKEVVINFPLVPPSPFNRYIQPPPVTASLRGVYAENLAMSDGIHSFHLKLGTANIDKLSFVEKKRNVALSIQGVGATNVDVNGPFGRLKIKEAKIPYGPDPKKPQGISVEYWHDGDLKKPQELTIRLGKLFSSGILTLNKSGAENGEGSGDESGKKSKPLLETSGSSTLSELEFHNYFGKTQSKIDTKFKFSGAVDSAQTTIPPVGFIGFTTVEKIDSKSIRHSVQGTVNAEVVLSHDPEVPRPPADYKVNLKLPYVGFTTQGRFTTPEGGAQLRNAEVDIDRDSIEARGDLNLKDASLVGFGEGKTNLGRFYLPEDSPKFEHINIHGRARFKFDQVGFTLERPEDSDGPLQASMDLVDSELHYDHMLKDTWVGKLLPANIIKSGARIKKAQVEIADLRKFEYRKKTDAKVEGGNFTKFSGGPALIHHVEGEGIIWAPLPLLGYIRQDFPNIGTSPKGGSVRSPSAHPLLKHLPKSVRERIGDSNFFRVEDIDVEFQPEKWDLHLRDVILNVHEKGRANHYLMLHLPQIFLEGDKEGARPQMGKGAYWANVFLQAQERGGQLRFFRWPVSPKSKEYYQK